MDAPAVVEHVADISWGVEKIVRFPTALASGDLVNDTVTLRLFLPNEANRPMPVVMLLHYWGATDIRMERALAAELGARGIASAVLALPYHLERTPEGTRSGELAIQPDPLKLRTSMTQSLQDARRALDILESMPEFYGRPIGVAGTSLGAIVAALLYAIDERPRDATFMLGGADLAHILWTSSRVVAQRETLRRNGFTEERLRESLADIEPLNYLSRRTTGSQLLVGARFDTVIPRRATEALAAALPDPQIIWLDTGHYGGFFIERRLLREVARFFAEKFEDRPFIASKGLRAPTIRVGAAFGIGAGFDIGLGLDLRPPSAPRREFASIFLTPRGPQLFIGQGIDRGISAGVGFRINRVTLGFLWSTVL